MLGTHVLNNIDFAYLPIEIDKTIPPKGYYWNEVAERALSEFVDQLFAIKQQNRSLGKALLNKHIGMFGKRAPLTYHVFAPFRDIKSHPLVRDCKLVENGTMYRFYHEFDYTYNFSMVYSLILSQAKANNERVFRYCHKHNIPMYYSSTDSLAIPTRCLPLMKQFVDDKALGKLKIEAQGDNAVFIAWCLYYINDNKFATKYIEHDRMIAYCKYNKITLHDLYMQLIRNQALLLSVNSFKAQLNSH